MLRTSSKIMSDMIVNGVELEVETIINKMKEGRLWWLGHVRKRPQSAPAKRVIKITFVTQRGIRQPCVAVEHFNLRIRSRHKSVEKLYFKMLHVLNMLRKCHWHGLTKGAIIQIFYHGLDEFTQAILDVTAEGIFLYKTLNLAFQFLEDKVLFQLDWSIKYEIEHHQSSVAFTDGSNSDVDNS
nr:reverse transcriptase domain-containing protein [Tanacetum cinerariifolium]